MAKNIVVFSDGTGQAGGLMPDETRSNVYKLFRAARCGPDSIVDPAAQLAFYDPGLGSVSDGREFHISFLRRIHDLLAKATGLGITRNIVDCYAEIIRAWEEPGEDGEKDRIFLFGFSRGAYTARCVGGVLANCGVPTRRDGAPIRRDPASIRAIAEEAVAIYQYGSSIKGDPYEGERKRRAAEFRVRHGSAEGERSNAEPYFIGVWDTVATLGVRKWTGLLVAFVFALAVVLVHSVAVFLDRPLGWMGSAVVVVGVAFVVWSVASIRHRQPLDLARYRMAFYNTRLSPRVAFARHALSIDENRADFARVLWDEDGSERLMRRDGAPERFVQLWFAGVHSDIGGSYAETESRLSDIALAWMVEEATRLPHPLLVDRSYLRLSPSPAGMQHDERKSTIASMYRPIRWIVGKLFGPDRIGWRKGLRVVDPHAPLHPSVLERFRLDGVVAYDEVGPYRPESLRDHVEVRDHYRRTS